MSAIRVVIAQTPADFRRICKEQGLDIQATDFIVSGLTTRELIALTREYCAEEVFPAVWAQRLGLRECEPS